MRERSKVGFTVLELMVVICIAGILVTFWLPRAARLMDWIATDRARHDITTAIALARHSAVQQATRARLTIAADTLRIDRLQAAGWVPFWRWPGPASHGVTLQISNPVVVFGPNGMGWGASNTTIRLMRGSHVETITMSRVGRVKVW